MPYCLPIAFLLIPTHSATSSTHEREWFGRRNEPALGLRDDLLDDAPSDVRQAKLASLEQISQLLVVNPQQVKNGGLQIQNVNSAFRHIESVVVRTAVHVSRLDAATAHP